MLLGCNNVSQEATEVDPQTIADIETAFYTGQQEEGANLVLQALDTAPEDPRLLELQAGFHLRDGDFEAAESNARRALELDSESAFAIGVLAWLQAFNVGDLDTASELVEQGLAVDADHPLVLNVQATIASERNDNATELALNERVIEVRPDYIAAYLNRGWTNIDAGNADVALEAFNRAIEINPDSLNAWQGQAEAHALVEDYDAALSSVDRALEILPGDPGLYYSRGLVNYYNGQYQAAAEDYSRSIEAGQEDLYIYWDRGIVYDELGDYDAAIQDYTTAIEQGIDDPYVYSYRATSYVQKGDIDAALADYQTWVNIDPNNTDANNEYGYFLALFDIDLQEARNQLQIALNANPDASDYVDTQAYILYKDNDLEAARDLFQSLVDQGYTYGNYGLGLVAEANGNVEEAVTYYEQFLNEFSLTLATPDAQRRLANLQS